MMPKPWPWNHLKSLRPADWGIGMTVCISAICKNGKDKNCVIMASDQMLCMGGYTSADRCTIKLDPLYYHWFSQFAANNISAVFPIYESIRKLEVVVTAVTDVAGLCKAAYKSQRLERIEDEILSAYGLTWKDMKTNIRERLSERDFQILTERIRQYDLDVEMLVGGFDDCSLPHIFTIRNPGTVDYYDKLGFWAIGSGQPNALASLFSSHYRTTAPLDECVAHVLSAKFSAESAQGVGKSTFLAIYTSEDELLFLTPKLEEDVKEEWNELPRIPKAHLSKIREELYQSMTTPSKQSDS
jgi:hypothetical protein